MGSDQLHVHAIWWGYFLLAPPVMVFAPAALPPFPHALHPLPFLPLSLFFCYHSLHLFFLYMTIELISTPEMMGTVSTDLRTSASLSSSSVSALLMEDLSKKVRKPYTITKSRESWTDQEHDKFLEALQM